MVAAANDDAQIAAWEGSAASSGARDAAAAHEDHPLVRGRPSLARASSFEGMALNFRAWALRRSRCICFPRTLPHRARAPAKDQANSALRWKRWLSKSVSAQYGICSIFSPARRR
ncbi:MAG: hypothetical protein ACLUEQ_11920 [Cloacibacillus evryensis]